MKRTTLGLTLALALGLSQSASAALIDFTDGGWTANNPRLFGSLSVTLAAFDTDGNSTSFTESLFDGDSDVECVSYGLACTSDGIGIDDDEVSFGTGGKTQVQRLKVSFSEEVDILSLFFLDLFSEDSTTDRPDEYVQFQVNNGAGGGFKGTASDRTGFFAGSFANTNPVSSMDLLKGVSSIEFFADTAPNLISPANTDFALAGIRIYEVPEPGTMALFGWGLAGLGAASMRRKKAQK